MKEPYLAPFLFFSIVGKVSVSPRSPGSLSTILCAPWLSPSDASIKGSFLKELPELLPLRTWELGVSEN